MKILFLYNNDIALQLVDWLQSLNHEVKIQQDILCYEEVEKEKFDLAISYTYRFIIKENIISLMNGNIVNLHISYLPWNKGANPNQWSFIEETPKGVTLHYIDSKLDTGDIINQRLVSMNHNETLKSSYAKLNLAMVDLFKETFVYYDMWHEMRKKAQGKGTYHSLKDFEQYQELISSWNMPIRDFKNAVYKLNKRK